MSEEVLTKVKEEEIAKVIDNSDFYKRIMEDLVSTGLNAYGIPMDFVILDINSRNKYKDAVVKDAYLSFNNVRFYLHPLHPEEYGMVVVDLFARGYLNGKVTFVYDGPIQLSCLISMDRLLAVNPDKAVAGAVFCDELAKYMNNVTEVTEDLGEFLGVKLHGYSLDPTIPYKRFNEMFMKKFEVIVKESFSEYFIKGLTAPIHGSNYATLNNVKAKVSYDVKTKADGLETRTYKWLIATQWLVKGKQTMVNSNFVIEVPYNYSNPVHVKKLVEDIKEYFTNKTIPSIANNQKLEKGAYISFGRDLGIPEAWERIISKENYERIVTNLKYLESQKAIKVEKVADGLITISYKGKTKDELVVCGSEGFVYLSDLTGYCRNDDREDNRNKAKQEVGNHLAELNKILFTVYDFRRKLVIPASTLEKKGGVK